MASPGMKPHREEHQNGDQKKSRDQQQDPPGNVRSHVPQSPYSRFTG